MVIVFSTIVADISSEFVDKFPNPGRVDLLGLLQNVCEDTNVELITDINIADGYKLKGSWEPISKAYILLKESVQLFNFTPEENICIEKGNNQNEICSQADDIKLDENWTTFRKSSGIIVTECELEDRGFKTATECSSLKEANITSNRLSNSEHDLFVHEHSFDASLSIDDNADVCNRLENARNQSEFEKVDGFTATRCLRQRKKHSIIPVSVTDADIEESEWPGQEYTGSVLSISSTTVLDRSTSVRCLRQRKTKKNLGTKKETLECYKYDNLPTDSAPSKKKYKKGKRKLKNDAVEEVECDNQIEFNPVINSEINGKETMEDGSEVLKTELKRAGVSETSPQKVTKTGRKKMQNSKNFRMNNQKIVSKTENKSENVYIDFEAAEKNQSAQDDDMVSNASMQKDNEENEFFPPIGEIHTQATVVGKLSSVSRRKRFDFSRSKFPSMKKQLSSSLYTRSVLLKKRGRPRKYCNRSSKYYCPDCDFVAKTRNALGDHKHRVHLAKPTKCDVCEKVFPNVRYMKRHRTSHVEPQHCCDICGKMYKILKALRDHRKTHDDDYERPEFPCSKCSKTFCTRYIMKCHFKSEHLGLKRRFLCSTCGKSFTTKHTLQQHLNVHSGVKPYSCDKCKKSFSYESALRDHKYIHEGEKNFVCSVCDKAFRQRSALKMHEKIHREKKEFTCEECGRGFTQKQALQRHERAHKGLKPFSCKLCGRTFGDASIIRRHMILVHKVNKDPSIWREDIIMNTSKSGENEPSPLQQIDDTFESSPSNPAHIIKNSSGKISRKSAPKVRSNARKNVTVDEAGNKSSKKLFVQEQVLNDPMDHSTTASVNMSSVVPVDGLFPTIPSSLHTASGSSSVQNSLYSMEMSPHLHNIDYQYQNAHNIEHPRTFPYASSTPNQIVDPRYQPIHETMTPTNHDEIAQKRLHDMEPPDNLSISSLYAYYTNLASQYMNVNSYPNYMPSQENSNQEHQ